MHEEEQVRIYVIPDNYIDESRIFRGMFRTRNFIEGVILALIGAIPAFLIPVSTINTRIVLVVCLCAPLFLLGNNGYNGDPISTTLKNMQSWYKNRGLMVYNSNTRALKETPLDNMMHTEAPRDKIIDILEKLKAVRRDRCNEKQYIEGVTFEFAEDLDLAGLYADEPRAEDRSETAAQQKEAADDAVGTMKFSPAVEIVDVAVNSDRPPEESKNSDIIEIDINEGE